MPMSYSGEIAVDSVAPGARADSQIDKFISRQAAKVGEDRPGRDFANAVEWQWKDAERERAADQERRRRIRRLLHHRKRQELHAALAEEHRQAAKRIKEEGDQRPAEEAFAECERRARKKEQKLLWDRLRWHEASLRRKTADYHRARDHHTRQAVLIAAMLDVEPQVDTSIQAQQEETA
jgi:hypothetical protein